MTVTFVGSGDAFGNGGRNQACISIESPKQDGRVLLDCGATSLTPMKRLGIDPNDVTTVFISHLHGDHFGGLPFLILDGQFRRRHTSLTIAGPPSTRERLFTAMECLFPGSAGAHRRFDVNVVELAPREPESLAGLDVLPREVLHPSGAPAFGYRLHAEGRTIAYTGDTAWTDQIALLAAGADLLIAEAYSFDEPIPHHLSHAQLVAHADQLMSKRVIITHMSPTMLAETPSSGFEMASDGLVLKL